MALKTGQADSFAPAITTAGWGGRATRAEVSLDAIASNLAAVRQHVGASRVMAVVKADAYGHGSVAVARAAVAAGADWLGVYTLEEGVVLRRAGVAAPILVFGPIAPDEAVGIWTHNLTPTVTNLETGDALQAAAEGRTLGYHVKVDTGLNRAGVPVSDASGLLRALSVLPALRPEGIYTHFARADEADKSCTQNQIELFLALTRSLSDAGFHFSLRHTANSAAAIDMADCCLDMIRLGISLYGYYPSAEVGRRVPLRPALSLLSAVTRVNRIPPGAGVGYGYEFRAERETAIALVPIGYGDGLPRTLGNGRGRVLIRGRFAPIVGRVSMDQITVDVTDIPDVLVGDEAVLIGLQQQVQTADDLAEQAGTISYDILTGLLPRVPRIYAAGGAVVAYRTLSDGPFPVAAGAGTPSR